jgi:hypothetical protein
VVSFIGGWNRSTWRKPLTSHWQTLSHNECCIEYNSPERDSNSQF